MLRCLPAGIRRVQDLCKVLQLPAAFEETAVSYLRRALGLRAFHLVSLEKKELLGGCCVLVTCRQHNWPLTMGTVCSLLYAKQELFASVFLSLQKELGLSVPALSLADLVTTHLNRCRGPFCSPCLSWVGGERLRCGRGQGWVGFCPSLVTPGL